MKMKNKLKLKTMLLAIMIILVPLTSTSTQAWWTTSYTFDFSQDPYELNVRVGDIVVVSVERIPDSGKELEKVLEKAFGSITVLEFTKNDGDIVVVYPDQTLPTMLNPITFTIGSFDIGDIIAYRVWLVLDDAPDFYDSSSFEVFSQDIPVVPVPGEIQWWGYLLIAVGVLVVLLGLAYLYKKRRGL